MAQLVDAGQSPLGLSVGGQLQVGAQQLVGNFAFPTRDHGLPNAPRQQLEQQDAQRKNVTPHRGCLPLVTLRCNVEMRARRRLPALVLLNRQPHAGDAQLIEPVRLQQLPTAEVGEQHVGVCGAALHQHVGRFQVFVEHAHGVRCGHGIGNL